MIRAQSFWKKYKFFKLFLLFTIFEAAYAVLYRHFPSSDDGGVIFDTNYNSSRSSSAYIKCFINFRGNGLNIPCKRLERISSQKHILEKERYIRCDGPRGFQTVEVRKDVEFSDRTQEAVADLKSQFPNASLRQIWKSFNYTGPIRKGTLSGRLFPSKWVQRPNYYKTGRPKYVPYPREYEGERGEEDERGTLKTEQEIEGIRKACRIAREILDSLHDVIVEGNFTDDIDRKLHKMCEIKRVYPSPLRYHGFPKSVCTSVNEIACHGIPDSTVLAAGDLVNVDVTIFVGGFHGDVSETFMVLPNKNSRKRIRPKHTMGMYEQRKMRFNAATHDNISDCASTVTMQLDILKRFDAAVRQLKNTDGWPELLEILFEPYGSDRRSLFYSGAAVDDNLKIIGTRLSKDLESFYTEKLDEKNVYNGRIIGLQASLLPNCTLENSNVKKFYDMESPELVYGIFRLTDPERYYKPYIFSHTFDEDVELMKITYEAVMKAIEICGPGVMIKEIGRVISEYVESKGCRSLPNLVGHGIGRNFHEFPYINHVRNDDKIVMEPGMVFTIEPIVTRGETTETILWPDGWTVATSDGSKTAQFEHVILITETGHEILTKRLPSSPPLYWDNPIQIRY